VRLGSAAAFVGIVVAAGASSLQGRLGDAILGRCFMAGVVLAVAGLALAGLAYNRRSGAELLTRGIWSSGAADRHRGPAARRHGGDDSCP
jgi:hypothetical protein